MNNIGRNDPCPCGSGKKFKRCCLSTTSSSIATYFYKDNLIENADNFEIHKCYINLNWQKSGLAQIVVLRNQTNGKFIFGAYLVDIFCLGIKDSFCNAELNSEDIDDFLKKYYSEVEPVEIEFDHAKEIIFGAITYAKELGFEPHEDFNFAKHILGKYRMQNNYTVRFGGPNGKPFYVSGPHDDVKKIQRTLSDKLGNDNYEFLIGGPILS